MKTNEKRMVLYSFSEVFISIFSSNSNLNLEFGQWIHNLFRINKYSSNFLWISIHFE